VFVRSGRCSGLERNTIKLLRVCLFIQGAAQPDRAQVGFCALSEVANGFSLAWRGLAMWNDALVAAAINVALKGAANQVA
jgi:hypothetical protein